MEKNVFLATSDSNVAVDNIAAGLHAAGIKVVRTILGQPRSILIGAERGRRIINYPSHPSLPTRGARERYGARE